MSDSKHIEQALAAQAAHWAVGQERKAHLCRILEAMAEIGRRGSGDVRSDLCELIGGIESFRIAMHMSFAAESQALAVIADALRGIRRRAL